MKGLKLSIVILAASLLGGCSPDGEVLFKDLEAKATHLILGYVFGDASPKSKEPPEEDRSMGHTPPRTDTL